jgi:hypothetical protein
MTLIHSIPAFKDRYGLVVTTEACHSILERIHHTSDDVVISLSEVSFVEPPFVVLLALLIRKLHQLKPRDTEIRVQWPQNPKVRQYLANIGFDEGFLREEDRIVPVAMADHVRLTHFTGAQPDVIVSIAECVRRRFSGVPDIYASLENSFAELMDNVKTHSQSSVGGFLAGQYYPRIPMLRIAVGDFGISIPGHLSRSFRFASGLSDGRLLAESFKPGVSGALDHARSGMGMTYVREFTASIYGRLRTYSRYGVVSIESDRLSQEDVASAFPGTLYTMDWPTV